MYMYLLTNILMYTQIYIYIHMCVCVYVCVCVCVRQNVYADAKFRDLEGLFICTLHILFANRVYLKSTYI